MNSIHYNHIIQHGLSVTFGRVFALPLSRFFAPWSGFDRAAFGDALFSSADRLEENVRLHYGDEGIFILRKLDCAEPLSDAEKDEAARHLGRYYVAAVSAAHEFPEVSERTEPMYRAGVHAPV